MFNVLGIDKVVFERVSTKEKAAYHMASISFLIVIVMSLLANGYFGFSMYGTWVWAIVFAVFLGFIQFSILRIALITLMTKALPESIYIVDTTDISNSKVKKIYNSLKNIKVNLGSILRVLFVGIVAVCIAFPLSTFVLHNEADKIQSDYKRELTNNFKERLSKSQLLHDVEQASFPFYVYEKLLNKEEFNLLLLIFSIIVFIPLILVERLRRSKTFEYIENARQEMLKLVAIDYNETIEQCQHLLDKNHPTQRVILADCTVYSDAPYNSTFKNNSKRNVVTKAGFNQFIQSIK